MARKHLILKALGPKNVALVALGVLTALVVVALLLYSNLSVLGLMAYFEKNDPYNDSIVLFYGEGCQQCKTVDTYLAKNKVIEKIPFVRLEVFDNMENRNVLSDKAQACGIPTHDIGVPFVWVGPQQTCILGYLDVIEFFKQRLKTAVAP